MRVLGLDGRNHAMVFGPGNRPREKVSSLHALAREILKETFPLEVIWEEVFLPGCPMRLFLDFLLPRRGLAVEVQGRQHFEMVRAWHGGREGFLRSRWRDRTKERFCHANEWRLIVLVEGQEDVWRGQVRDS